MDLTITVRNYRCFDESRPATFTIRDGLTAFVGPNNAGKSATLKFIYELRPFFATASTEFISLLRSHVDWEPAPEVQDWTAMFSEISPGPIKLEMFSPAKPHGLANMSGVCRLRIEIQRASHLPSSIPEISIEAIGGVHKNPYSLQSSVIRAEDGSGRFWRPDYSSWDFVFRTLADSLYLPAFRNAANSGGAKLYDIPIGTEFIKQWNEWKTGENRAGNEAASRVTAQIASLLGYERLEINASSDMKTLALVIDGRHRRLNEVGSGTQQLIVTLIAVATRGPSLLLIDEPELNLHPSLQIDFLTALSQYAKVGTLFATHSLGLARATADRIYSLQREKLPGGHSVSVMKLYDQTTKLSEFLGSMSFASYAACGFDQVLLVEGRTDVLLFHQWLRKLKLDHRVLVLPLGGGEMINDKCERELTELKRICPKLTAIVDSDRTEAGGKPGTEPTKFANVCGRVGIACHLTERRSTDNYFPDHAVRRAFGEKMAVLGPYEKRDGEPPWGKTTGWKIADHMTREELMATDIGEVLSKLGAPQ